MLGAEYFFQANAICVNKPNRDTVCVLCVFRNMWVCPLLH